MEALEAQEPLLKKFIKAFQRLDKTFSAIQVYSDFDSDMLGKEFPLVKEEFEEYYGKYQNALEIVSSGSTGGGDDPEINIEYELESIRTDEISYEYILMLIQQFVPTGDDEYELIAREDAKVSAEVDKYIGELNRNNPKLASMMETLWRNIQENPEDYRDKNISNVLEDMIEESKHRFIHDFSEKWSVKEDELAYVVENYNPNREKQNGENELKTTANYQLYRETATEPVPKLKYWKTVRHNLKDLMQKEILPLQRR